jgi:hypothetical protein
MRETSETRTKRVKTRTSSGYGSTSQNPDTAALVYRSPQSDVASNYRHDSAPADPFGLQSRDDLNGDSVIRQVNSFHSILPISNHFFNHFALIQSSTEPDSL